MPSCSTRLGGFGIACSALLLWASGILQAETQSGTAAPSSDKPSSDKQAAADSPGAADGPGTAEALRKLVGQYLELPSLPSNPIVWRLFPAAALLDGTRLMGWLETETASDLPAELVSVECSRRFLENYFQRAVERDAPVDDQILGTRIAGQSHLSGQVKLVWHTPDQPAGFDLIFSGVCRSQTDGLNEVVTLHNQAETVFEARKQLIWTGEGLQGSPAVAQAETHSTTVKIDSSLPGVVGRIATRIAQDRVAEVRPQADAISSQHAAERIARGFDARVDHSLAMLEMASHHLPAAIRLGRATRVHLTSSDDTMRLSFLRLGVSEAELAIATSEMRENCDVAIRLNRGVLGNALADRLVLLVGGRILLQMVANEEEGSAPQPVHPTQGGTIKTAVVESSVAPAPLPHWRLSRTRDGQWMVVEHFSPPSTSEPSPGETPPQAPRPAAKLMPVSTQRPQAF